MRNENNDDEEDDDGKKEYHDHFKIYTDTLDDDHWLSPDDIMNSCVAFIRRLSCAANIHRNKLKYKHTMSQQITLQE